MIQSWLNRRKQGSAKGLVGIEATSEGLAIAHVITSGNGQSHLKVCDFIGLGFDGDSGPETEQRFHAETAAQLKKRIGALGLQRVPTNWVLSNSQYSLLLVEAPNVAASEIREAMRWRVQELSPVPIEDATIDVFPLPEDSVRGGAKMVYVVVAHKSHVENTIAQVSSAHLVLASIDIAEMCLRNIVERAANTDRSIAIVRIQRGSANLALLRRERLYLSRQFELPYNGGLFDELPEDKLVLELQRSLDYYERQMGQVPPARIIVCGDHISADKITDNLRRSLPAEPVCLELSQILSGTEKVDENILSLCLGAVGAALRKPVAA